MVADAETACLVHFAEQTDKISIDFRLYGMRDLRGIAHLFEMKFQRVRNIQREVLKREIVVQIILFIPSCSVMDTDASSLSVHIF